MPRREGSQAAQPGETPAASVDLESSYGVATWWITAILVYAVMLFGVALAYPSPPEGIALVLLAVEIVAAYLINRALWQKARNWSVARVKKLVIYLAAAVVVLMVLVWVRRRFLG